MLAPASPGSARCRHLAQAVHVVGEGEQPGRNVGAMTLEGAAHHGGAHHLAEGADMRQARRAVAGLEQHIAFGRRRFLVARDQLARLLEGPGARGLGILPFGTHHFPRENQSQPAEPSDCGRVGQAGSRRKTAESGRFCAYLSRQPISAISGRWSEPSLGPSPALSSATRPRTQTWSSGSRTSGGSQIGQDGRSLRSLARPAARSSSRR